MRDIKPNGKTYILIKPYYEWPHYAIEPTKLFIGHKIQECQDGWYQVEQKELRYGAVKVRQLFRNGFLKEI
jgi:hypothetical protein